MKHQDKMTALAAIRLKLLRMQHFTDNLHHGDRMGIDDAVSVAAMAEDFKKMSDQLVLDIRTKV